jgi:hypothetical protein
MKIISPVCSTSCYGRLPIQIKRNSRNRPQQIPLENKGKIIAPKVTNDAATILSKKEVPILCYHNIKDLMPVLAQ